MIVKRCWDKSRGFEVKIPKFVNLARSRILVGTPLCKQISVGSRSFLTYYYEPNAEGGDRAEMLT